MDLNGFEDYLKDHKFETKTVNSSVDIVNEFDAYLSKRGKTAKEAVYGDLQDFSSYLIENESNIFDNYLGLLYYGYYMKNKPLIIASLEVIDGSEVMVNFSKRLTDEFGEELRNEIFEGIAIPPLGMHPEKKPAITKTLIERFLAKVGREKCVDFLANGLRDKYTESYKPAREMFLKSANIDEFLKKRHEKFVNDLQGHLEKKTLFYTQEITEKVVEYVKNTPNIGSGIREGNNVIMTKIPYMTKQFLSEKGEMKKRYYYCHCPWVREALKKEDKPVSSVFCNCSGGYYKNFWEAVLEQPVKIELQESVIMGDEVCKFTMSLPEEELNKLK